MVILKECFLGRSGVFIAYVPDRRKIDFAPGFLWKMLYMVPSLACLDLIDGDFYILLINPRHGLQFLPKSLLEWLFSLREFSINILIPKLLKKSHDRSLLTYQIFLPLVIQYISSKWTTNSWCDLSGLFLYCLGLLLSRVLQICDFRLILERLIGYFDFNLIRGILNLSIIVGGD